MKNQEYDYYAFISYSRVDEKWAKWLQHKLETYRFPTLLRKENQEIPSRIFPVFRDKTDLSSGVLVEQLQHQLESSEYLIVICSPASAKAEWVEREITYFQELGRNRNIIPLIVEGEPHAADSEQECYPPALLNCTEDELLGVSVEELGRNKAVLRVIASLLHLRFDQLVMRDKRRTMKRRTVAAGMLMALLAVIAGVIWYEMPHTAYYWSYVYQNEVPKGLIKIDGRARKTAHDYYKIVTRHSQVIRLTRVNSAGTATRGVTTDAIDGYYDMEFAYDDQKKLVSVTCRDVDGSTLLVKQYTQNLGAVDFKNPEDAAMVGRLPGDLGSNRSITSLMLTAGRGEITRQLLQYDADGFLLQELYMWDNRNTPVCDQNGIYGKQYTRDETGKIMRVTNLGRDGEPLRMQHGKAVAFTDYEYDSYGRIIRCSVYDADGHPMLDEQKVFCWEYSYDTRGCITQTRCFDSGGNLAPDLSGVSQYQMSYDENGFLKEKCCLDKEGAAVYDKSEGIYRVIYENDDKGREVREEYYDSQGNRMNCGSGYAGESIRYDSQNRVIEVWFYGLNGELACALDCSNVAGYTLEYQEGENTLVWTSYNQDGEIGLNQGGYAICIEKFNEQGMLKVMSYYDADGNPIRARANAASVVYGYDNAGHLTSLSYFDETGLPCCNNFGAAVIRYEYDWAGNQTSESYYDESGVQCFIKWEGGDFAKWEAEYNSYGQMTSVRYFDAVGELIHVNGAQEQRFEYDERGNCIRQAYYNVSGELVNGSDKYAVR